MKINNIIGTSLVILLLSCKSAIAADDFWDRLGDLAWDVTKAAGAQYVKNEIDKSYRDDYAVKINQLRTEASSNSYNNSEVRALLNNIETLNNKNLRAQNKITELEKMLIQQNNIIIKKNKNSKISGSDFIKSFYSLSKAVSLTESYSLLSNNAQQKLGFGDYSNWWGKTVKSVYVDKVTPLGSEKYKVNLSYYKHNGGYQCSEDIIYLLWNHSKWLINDFTWGKCN